MTRSITETIGNTITFLAESRGKDQLWSDFNLYPGESDEWVSGYTGSVLCFSGESMALECSREAWGILCMKRRKGYGGWGYNIRAMEDADSTVWCLSLANRLGMGGGPRAELAVKFIHEHVTTDTGISTYLKDHLFKMAVPDETSLLYRGWMQAHACVTAAAALLDQFNELLAPYLIRNQQEQGYWKGYWWFDHEYATALAVEAIFHSGDENSGSCIEKASEWAENRFSSKGFIANEFFREGSPFATALGIRILLLASKTPRRSALLHKATHWLIGQQLPDGGWKASSLLRVPPPSLTDPDDFKNWDYLGNKKWGTITIDQNRLFTTATALQTLVMIDSQGNLR